MLPNVLSMSIDYNVNLHFLSMSIDYNVNLHFLGLTLLSVYRFQKGVDLLGRLFVFGYDRVVSFISNVEPNQKLKILVSGLICLFSYYLYT